MLRTFLSPVLISLVALVSHGAVPEISVHAQDHPLLRARILTEVSFEPASTMFSVNGSFAEDQSFSYLGTPGGLVRFPRLIEEGSEGTLIAFPGKSINNLYIHEGSLYVLKDGEASTGPGNDHTFLRSDDGGRTSHRWIASWSTASTESVSSCLRHKLRSAAGISFSQRAATWWRRKTAGRTGKP